MSPGARGEEYIDTEGQQYPVLFTNRALAEAERLLGKGIMQIAMAIDNIAVTDVARLAVIGLEHARKDRKDARRSYTLDDAYGLLDEFGVVPVATAVYNAMAAVLNYERGGGADPQP